MALAISTIGVYALSHLFEFAFQGNAKISVNFERISIKRQLLSNISCADSLPKGLCTPNSLIEIKGRRKNGSTYTILKKNGLGTRIGKFAIRAQCSTDGDGIFFQFARLKPRASINSNATVDFLKEPGSDNVVTWNNPKSSLLPLGLPICLGGNSEVDKDPGPDLSKCTTISVPFIPDNRQRTQMCPTSHPYFSSVWLIQEDVGKDSDFINKIECCK